MAFLLDHEKSSKTSGVNGNSIVAQNGSHTIMKKETGCNNYKKAESGIYYPVANSVRRVDS